MTTESSPLSVGDERVVDIGVIAHGGHHIAHTDGTTVFVRHAISGERVRIRITSTSKTAMRADAIEILEASPDRVTAPCRYARPGGCGGCDFQHISLPAQRDAKATVIRDALRRFADLDLDVTVQELPGHPDGLRWRTRMHWAVGPDGQLGLRRYRSHDVVAVDDCLIAASAIAKPAPGFAAVGSDGRVSIGTQRVREQVRGVEWRIRPDGFWQVHPALAEVLTDRVLATGEPGPGEVWWDLYAGAGLFSAVLADAVGVTGRVVAVESSVEATKAARRALHAMPQVWLHTTDVEEWLTGEHAVPDGVVLDPPRSGAGRSVVESLIRVAPRKIVYVACDPVALARDLAWLRAGGYRVASLAAYDGFPMTHHVECVAHLISNKIS